MRRSRLRAFICRQSGRRDEAVIDLAKALDVTEQVRSQTSGAEQRAGQSFGGYAASL